MTSGTSEIQEHIPDNATEVMRIRKQHRRAEKSFNDDESGKRGDANATKKSVSRRERCEMREIVVSFPTPRVHRGVKRVELDFCYQNANKRRRYFFIMGEHGSVVIIDPTMSIVPVSVRFTLTKILSCLRRSAIWRMEFLAWQSMTTDDGWLSIEMEKKKKRLIELTV